MKHITKAKMEQICKASDAIGELETGCRQRIKVRESMRIELIKKHSTECKSAPKKYSILYSHTDNLGTKKWADTYASVECMFVNEKDTVRETEKSIIVVSPSGYRRVIDKMKILAYCW